MTEKTQADELREAAEDQRKDAERLREENPPQGETDEDYYARVRSVPGVFGDTDTTAGPDASQVEVPASNNEAATVAVAEADAQAEEGDEDAQEATADEARSQASYGRVSEDAETGEAVPADATPEEAEQVTEEDNEADEDDEDV